MIAENKKKNYWKNLLHFHDFDFDILFVCVIL